MTPTEIFAVTLMAGIVICAIYTIAMRSARKLIDALSADAGLDAEPCRQPRASTEPEPSGVEVLFCVVFLVAAITALGLLWCGFADAMVGWMAAHVVAMHRY